MGLQTEPQTGPYEGPAALVVVEGEAPGRVYPLKVANVIGRHVEADVSLTSDDVSLQHACLCRTPSQGYEIIALAGHAVTVNYAAISRAPLRPGDRIGIGRTVFIFVGESSEQQTESLTRTRALGEFSSGIAHEFNNLLGAVMSNLGFVVRTSRCEDSVASTVIRPALEDAEEAIRRASELTARLAELADTVRVDQPIDVGKMLADVAVSVQQSEPHRVQVQLDVAEDLYLLGDPSALRRALLDLCANAFEAMPNGGQLSLMATSACCGDMVQIAVRDSGRGMDPLARHKALAPSFTTKPGRGVGLGLSFVDRVVQEHGGEVELSGGPGQGTQVSLFIPRTRLSGPPAHSTTSLPIVLLIDRDELFRTRIRRRLHSLGLNVWEAGDETMALARLRHDADSIALMVLDAQTVDTSVEATLQRIRALQPHTPVVLLASDHPKSEGDQSHRRMTRVSKNTLDPEIVHRRILEALGAED